MRENQTALRGEIPKSTTEPAPRLRMTPLLLGYAVNPPIMAVLWLLARAGLIAPQPLWAYCVVLWGGGLLGTGAELWFRRRPSRLTEHARAAAVTAATTAAIYVTGWGSVIAVAYAFGAQELLGRHGSKAWRMTAVWTVAGIAAGELAVGLGVAPTLLSTSLAHGLAILEAVGIVIAVRMMGVVTAQKERAEASLRESEDRFRSLVQNSSDVTLVFDSSGMLTYASEATLRVLGRAPEDLVGQRASAFAEADDFARVRARLRAELAESEASQPVQVRMRHADGSLRDIEAVVSNLRDRPSVRGYVVNARDVTERKRAEAALAHQALHDALTALPNRLLLIDRLEQSLARSSRAPERTPAVMFLDLDRFKLVNDGLGHDAGDELLAAVAERLRVTVRPEDTVARFGGDEFVVLCDGVTDAEQALTLARRILDCFASPFIVREEELLISTSIGIALSDGADTVEGLLRDADVAMYRAKAAGPGRAQLFDATTRDDALLRMHTESALRRAFEDGDLRIHYQPIFELAGLTPVGVEALLRWEHPSRGLLGPTEFIEMAESSGLIVPIGAWVLQQACQQVRDWNAAAVCSRPLGLNVNLSARQLVEPGLVDTVREALAWSEFDPDRLELFLEVTETLMVKDPHGAAARLDEIRSLGVGIAIDDFGTGYSSLSYLRRFPVGIVKIDRTFVAGLGADGLDGAIVAAVIRLGHELGLQVVAEGVETDIQLALLRDMGCDYAQGFLLGKPQPPDQVDFAAWRSPRSNVAVSPAPTRPPAPTIANATRGDVASSTGPPIR